jgi:hypothetical protein
VSHSYRAGADAGIRAQKHLACWSVALALAALSIATSAAAQEAPAAEKPVSAPEDLAIPLVEVSQRAEQTALVLSKAAATFPQTPDVAEIEEQIPETERSLEERRRLLTRNLESGVFRGRLSDVSAEWGQTSAQLDSWRKTLTPKLLEIESAIESLVKEQEVWERTREKAKGVDSPQTITKRISATLSEINGAIATAREHQSSLLTLQDRIVQQDLLATAALDQIRAAQRESRSSLFERNAPALWRDLFGVHPSEHYDDTRTSIGEDLRKVREFAAASGSRFLLDLLIFIVVVRYAFAVKRRLENPIEGIPPIGRSGDLFRRPARATRAPGAIPAPTADALGGLGDRHTPHVIARPPDRTRRSARGRTPVRPRSRRNDRDPALVDETVSTPRDVRRRTCSSAAGPWDARNADPLVAGDLL